MAASVEASDAALPALSLRDASFGYGVVRAVEGVSGTVGRGEHLALVGPNGAGKSTLLKGIVGEAARLAGRVDLHGSRVFDLAYLPQQPEIDRSFPITVTEFAATGLWRRLGPWRRYGAAHRDEVGGALRRVGLDSAAARLIGALSGGQMQRLLFARTLLQDARLILLDEPFTAIDAETEADLLAIVRCWRDEGRTVMAALHDLSQVRAAFPRTLLLARRPIAWGDTPSVLTPENLAMASGRGLTAGALADVIASAALSAS